MGAFSSRHRYYCGRGGKYLLLMVRKRVFDSVYLVTLLVPSWSQALNFFPETLLTWRIHDLAPKVSASERMIVKDHPQIKLIHPIEQEQLQPGSNQPYSSLFTRELGFEGRYLPYWASSNQMQAAVLKNSASQGYNVHIFCKVQSYVCAAPRQSSNCHENTSLAHFVLTQA